MLLFLKQLILKVRQYKIIIDVKYFCVCVYMQSNQMYSDTFNISHNLF